MQFNHQDHISKLPDPILSHILSFLKTREAVTTSVLSTRWLHLWTCSSLTSLTLDAHNILHHDLDFSHVDVSHMAPLERFLIKMKRTAHFVENVNRYLSRLTHLHNIRTFKVRFTFRHNGVFSHNLTRWISFALARCVDEIDLCLLEEDHYFSAPIEEGGVPYVFPCELLVERNNLKRLRLAHCVLAPQCATIFPGFHGITTLELSRVDLVSLGHFQNLLGNSGNLEYLSLRECGNIEWLKIENPFCQKLRYLNVKDCPDLRGIQLKGINVETLEYKGRVIDFCFWDAPRLTTAFTHVHDGRLVYSDLWPLIRLPIDLPHLQTLFLETTCRMSGVMSLPTFPNLQRLIILKAATVQHHDLCWITTFLKACPTLQRLELHLRTYYYVEEEKRDIKKWAPRCPHDQLNEIVITGMRGYLAEIETAIYLLNNATSLQKMTIDPRPRLYLGNGKWHLLEASESWSRIGKHKVYRHLSQQQLSPPLQLLIL
ncbi:F-box/FBD/LRR-repeat protein [Senna tora]|uniref:F-box/FBD/LRR-repeat protein n=1 Tax=Senna tora TaxID=362788 RepID=A0A834SUW2_9FABA|nr:F-box/FBD/LRR-repeat protein [Senna tora]